MIQLDNQLIDKVKTSSSSNLAGIIIATSIIGIWLASSIFLLSLDISRFNSLILIVLLLWQTFLYTGLFITSHDAMHGVILENNSKINHFIGSLCLTLYGFLNYKALLKKHWQHHHHPASQLDPDFHNGKHKNFFAWYFHFMKGYWNWRQIIMSAVIYNLVHAFLHIPKENLNWFWVIPSILSSVQLFYFGTYLPHKEPVGGYIQPHCATTCPRPIWWSFITCYHFGYHEEHHQLPYMAWWQLPKVYKLIKN